MADPITSRFDQRLAARFQQRQVDSLGYAQGIADEIEKIFSRTQRDIFELITGPDTVGAKTFAFPELIRRDAKKSSEVIKKGFTKLAERTHVETVGVLLDTIPTNWLWYLVPADKRMIEESIVNPRYGRLIFDGVGGMGIVFEEREPFGVPADLLRRTNLTEDEIEEILRKVVFPPPSQKEVTDIVSRGNWEDRLDSLSSLISDKKIAFNELVTGYAAGENIQQLRRRIEPLVAGVRSSAQRIARTEAMRVAEGMQRRAWDGLGEMMTGVQVIAVLDERTRPEHSTRNGQVYYKNPVAGQKSMADLPDLPDAPNCRCMTTPVLQPPAELMNDPKVRKAFERTSGSGLADPETYDKWFAAANEQKRKLVVGVRRYQEVAATLDRDPEWPDFIDPDGRLLTRAELAAETQTQRQLRIQQVKAEIAARGRARIEVSARGFEMPAAMAAKKLSKTGFTGNIKKVKGKKNLQRITKKWPDATPEKIARICGAPDGSDIEIDIQKDGSILVVTGYLDKRTGVSVTSVRRIIIGENGERILRNDYLRVEPEGSGVGLELFRSQVQAAAAEGFQKIQCSAAKGSGFNGYYTWPRMGYSAPIPPQVAEKAKAAFPQATTIRDLMETKEGRDWWKANGDWHEAEFDLAEGSQSRQTLERYYMERLKKNDSEAKESVTEAERQGPAIDRNNFVEGDIIDVDDEENEALLDIVWGIK